MKTKPLIKQYLDISYVDWLGPFSNLWVGFNCWYKTISPTLGDQEGVLQISKHPKASKAFSDDMEGANEIDKYVKNELRNLGTIDIPNQGTSYRDTTGAEFRMLCEKTNPAIDFLALAYNHPKLKHHCRGIVFLKPGVDPVFKDLYFNYKRWMMTRMWERFDAHRISTELQNIGIKHYGRMLIHDLKTKGSSPVGSLNDIYGKGYTGLISKVSNCTKSQLRKKTKDLDKSVVWSCKLAEGGDPFKRYLLILYKFRSAYFHGDLEPRSKVTQELAKNAYLSLRSIMERAV